MRDVVGYLPAVLAAVLGCFELALARRGRVSAGVRQLCLFGLCMGAAMAVLAPATGRAWSAALPALSGLTYPVGRELEILALYFLVSAVMALDLPGPRPGRSIRELRGAHVRLTVFTVVACGVLHPLAGATVAGERMVVHDDAGRAALAAFDGVFTLFSLWCVGLFVSAVHGRARGLRPGPLRTGLRLITAAGLVGWVWALWGLAPLIDTVRTGSQAAVQNPVSELLSGTCLLLAVAGASAALWRAPLAGPARWVRAWRGCRALRPLWSALRAAAPGTALRPGGRLTVLGGPGGAEYALYRRVIEIRDGYLALRPHLSPRAPAWTRDALARFPPDPARRASVIEAAALAAALQAARAGAPASAEHPAGAAGAGGAAGFGGFREASEAGGVAGFGAEEVTAHRLGRGADTVHEEAGWLTEVAEAYTRSPAVAEVRRRAAREFG